MKFKKEQAMTEEVGRSALNVTQLLQTSKLPLLEARALLSWVLGGVSTAWFIAHDRDIVDPSRVKAYEEAVIRRHLGEPLAYIVGEREFWGRTFGCRPGVLIPRPDTEVLLEMVLEVLPREASGWVMDLGCGTGILGVSLACERPDVHVLAIDRSAIATQLTQENARRHGVADRVQVIQSDWLSAVKAHPLFSVLMSNPPYIAPDDSHLSQGDLRFEPLSALCAPEQGCSDLFYLIDSADKFLCKKGWLCLEHGYNQGEYCLSRFQTPVWHRSEQRHDLSGWVRVTAAQKK
jgi:release factor glutamine methyltransferase